MINEFRKTYILEIMIIFIILVFPISIRVFHLVYPRILDH